MSQLDNQIANLLERLSMLSEAPAGNLEAQISRSAPESSAPGGSDDGFDRSADAQREHSLHVWYREEFARLKAAGLNDLRLSLYLAGEREYLRRIDPSTHDRTVERGSIVALSESGSVVEQVAALNVLKEFEGVHAMHAALVEGKAEHWIRKVRQQHRRDAEWGRPRAPFLDWDDEERRRQIRQQQQFAKDRGEYIGAKRLARHFGVAHKTIQRYMERPKATA
jgi:hypothetical protein